MFLKLAFSNEGADDKPKIIKTGLSLTFCLICSQ
jgi:hypothetical protein